MWVWVCVGQPVNLHTDASSCHTHQPVAPCSSSHTHTNQQRLRRLRRTPTGSLPQCCRSCLRYWQLTPTTPAGMRCAHRCARETVGGWLQPANQQPALLDRLVCHVTRGSCSSRQHVLSCVDAPCPGCRSHVCRCLLMPSSSMSQWQTSTRHSHSSHQQVRVGWVAVVSS